MLNKLKHAVEILDDALWIYKNLGNREFKIPAKGWTKQFYLLRVLSCFVSLFKKILSLVKIGHEDYCKEELLYINSLNTYKVLKFLESSKSSRILQESGLSNNTFNFSIIAILELPIAYIYALKLDFKFYLTYPDFFFENWGKLESNVSFLEKQSMLEIVIFANDHNVHNRLFLHACRMKNIKTVYLQHAPVSKYFPPLKFNQAFLFGEVDYETYLSIGVGDGVNVILSGMPHFDKYYKLRKEIVNTTPKVVGVSVNLLDDLKKLAQLLSELLRVYEVVVRFHPRDNRLEESSFKGVSFSNCNKESSFEYLAKIDMHIAGDSGIHLESILLNTPSFYFKMSTGPVKDYYRFVHHGVIKEISDIRCLNDLVDGKNVYMAAKPFCVSVGTENEGRVHDYVKEQVKLMKKKQVDNYD